MARTNRIKSDNDAYYHVMSRASNRAFLFGRGETKTALVDALRRAAAFSGVELEAYAAMDNHFHAVVKVVKPSEPMNDEELLRRVGMLKGEQKRLAMAVRWRRLALAGDETALESERGRLLARMHDVSEFVKTFKEEFDRAFKREREHFGSLWSGRFTSTLVEGGEYLARCKRYVIYNPVRAGLVAQAKDYPWCWRADGEAFTGSVPRSGEEGNSTESITEGWWLRRVAQLGAGKVFGSAGFVLRTAFALGDRFRSRRVAAHPVGAIGYSTHGWRLAWLAENAA